MDAKALYDSLPAAAKALNHHLLAGPVPGKAVEEEPGPVHRPAKVNKNEARYAAMHLRGRDARAHCMALYMGNGHRYIPDYVVFEGGMPVEIHEVKGSYALSSKQRSRLAFDQCRREFFPHIQWVWATWNGERYDTETFTTAKDIEQRAPEAGTEGGQPVGLAHP